MRSSLPKVLHSIAGDPMLAYPLRVADALRTQLIVCVLGDGLEQVQHVLAERGIQTKARLKLVRQTKQLGTADAVKVTESALKGHVGDVLILYGDVPFISQATLRKFIQKHRQGRTDLSILTTSLIEPHGYGRILRDQKGEVVQVIEQLDTTPSQRKIQEINSGIYLIKKSLLFSTLRKIKRNRRKGEYYLTDMVAILASRGARVAAHCIADPDEILGINSHIELAFANQLAREEINFGWMEKGVEFVDPASTLVDKSVSLAADVRLGPACVLRGKTRVQSGASIDVGSVLVDTTVGRGATIKPYCVLESTRVGVSSSIGPFAHLRTGSVIGEGAKVGNFVELKKTSLGKGAKANHLSYLGDAQIGADVNVGAGTITCNYDGFNKYVTKVGPRSFIGSDTQLVAPVTLGADAWIGAGSTITRDVPAGSLAVTRVEQVHVNGWSHRKRQKATKGKRG